MLRVSGFRSCRLYMIQQSKWQSTLYLYFGKIRAPDDTNFEGSQHIWFHHRFRLPKICVKDLFPDVSRFDCQGLASSFVRGSLRRGIFVLCFQIFRGSIAKDLLRVLFEVRFDKSTLWPRRAGCSRKGARPVQHMKVPEQALGNTSPSKNSCDRTRPQLGTYQLSH